MVARYILGYAVIMCLVFPLTANTAEKVRSIYNEPFSPSFKEEKREAERQHLFGGVAEGLAPFKLPATLTLETAQCGVVNAKYNSRTKTVTICYELIRHLKEAALVDYPKPHEHDYRETLTEGAVTFFLFHEIGHALIDLFRLRVTGHEEDVADQFATIAFVAAFVQWPDSNLGRSELNAILWFFEKGDGKLSDQAFADEHRFNKQRFYDIMCWAYGRDSNRFKYLAPALGSRLGRCSQEYENMGRGLAALLDPHIDWEAVNETNRQLGIDKRY